MAKVLKRAILVVLVLYLLLVVYRTFVLYGEKKTEMQVEKIHATKLTLDDVMGKNLPPMPSLPDATVQGVDANNNGIRDDVELAIFKAYPNSAKTRAVLLQYALALQMEFNQPQVNEQIADAVADMEDKSYSCVGKTFSQKADELRTFVEVKHLNTQERKKAQTSFFNSLNSHTLAKGSCDVEISALAN